MTDRLARIRRSDVALAAGFAAFALTEELLIRMPGDWWPFALAAAALLILFRRQFPLLVMVPNAISVLNMFYVPATVGGERTVNFRLWELVSMMIATYTVGRWVPPPGRSRRGILGLGLVLATAVLYLWNNDEDPMAGVLFPLAPYALGVVVAAQSRRLADTAAAWAELRERQAREAVMEERVRIARELHDMVAHSVTVMVVQAGVVRRRMEAGLPVDPELLRGVESAGREAVVELRRTLGLLRGEGDALAPVGLDNLDELIGQFREAGLAVTVRRAGQAVPLLPAVDLSAYRIVQEALTNVLKHAPAAAAELTVDYRADGLRLTVTNPGPVVAAPPGGTGHGLIGMRERAMLFGGELSAEPRPDGGFAVHATLPVLAR
ncbi:sensor histidine kinase [Actinoplanes oblitus]|uniref:histidine kinase n=1 Tax=Actinoplanes oblitus TaxID=3040509 RepID=A0ABY8W5X8_9ACTN|nr:sensor histidine kinase [Actinoplanes oblitus]WIM93229.1 sensor histidine kinase [Actinoplanes oblitus]